MTLKPGLHGVVISCRAPSADLSHQRFPTTATWPALLHRLVEDAPAIPGYELIKYSGEDEVFRATLEWHDDETPRSIDVVCKKTVSPGGLKGMADSLRTSRARKNFDRGLFLLCADIATPLPLAAVDQKSPRVNWLITEYIPDLIDLDRIALAELPQQPPLKRHQTKRAIVDVTAHFFVRLHRCNLHHRDLKASNILLGGWQSDAAALRVVLVDLDGLRPMKSSDRKRWQPVLRLAASLRDYPNLTRSDFARFLRTYLVETEGNFDGWKDRFRGLAQDAATYAAKSRARKSHKLDGYT